MSYNLFSLNQHFARKSHRCIWCGDHIKPGEGYLREKSVYDGSMQNLAWHVECKDDAEQDLRDGGDEEFMPYCADRKEILAAAQQTKGGTK